ncbi:hypothetical protein Kpol_1038p14 [Vanderwaltozyma polyspora DSM 70294]|uniref:Uncharacterized protein n=1 Tax=Vanderwaltozyma polyspora (strain ATCC 22028 / DSM 70294 / BCRC 21397 / CBS 2163 / NBRC 10782 / NRRL Y-8283 / UCD 57-17) TaxID=436907 RepID=A7TR05_VANPO|nr:uncharacterized protein Kpol_1038p14 [Vanderwaltozyma polyspora DSM 70294]EDO15308.1 hypothetical protein Kpol_1038p14 [Vanderwaltozyma polyspora DSM 70294]
MVNFDLKHVGVFRRKDKEHQYENTKNQETDNNMMDEDEYDASEFEDDENDMPLKVKNRRPREDNFTQQRLAAYNPVVTPRTILPLYLLIAAVFVIVGGCTLSISSKVDEIIIYYQNCTTEAPSDGTWSDMSSDHYSYSFKNNNTASVVPQWRYINDETDTSEERGTCQIRFDVPYNIPQPVYLSYLIEKFSPNHRRYVLSFSEAQLRGDAASYNTVHDNTGINCKPLVRDENGKIYYPCGLIANSMFNDTFPMELINVNDNSNNYPLTNEKINWHSDRRRYKKTKYNPDEITPPPYWIKQFPDGYNETNVPDIQEWEEFQNWMRPAAFDKFSKLIRRNGNDTLNAGLYEIDIGLHWPVAPYNGKKAIYLTHGSNIGGKNPFLGIIYLIGGCICAAMAVTILGFWTFFGRKVGDPSTLSWNRE